MTNYSIKKTTPADASEWLPDLLEFFKEQHIRYNEGDAEDAILTQYLNTAIELFELHSNGRIVLQCEITEYLPDFETPLQLHRGNVTSVDEINYYDEDDALQTLDPETYGTDVTGTPALVWVLEGEQYPSLNALRPRPVEVVYTAGWSVSSGDVVPDDVKQAIFLLATHFYTFRGDEAADVPAGFIRLANKYNTGLDVI